MDPESLLSQSFDSANNPLLKYLNECAQKLSTLKTMKFQTGILT